MDKRASIAALLTELDEATPRGFAVALHIKSHAPTFLFQTFPIDWIQHYQSNGLIMKDPMMHWAFAETGRRRWRDMVDADPMGVIKAAKQFGLNYGFTLSIHGDESRSLAGFSRSDRDYLDVEIDEIERVFTALEEETAGLSSLAPADVAALKAMSIRMTHG